MNRHLLRTVSIGLLLAMVALSIFVNSAMASSLAVRRRAGISGINGGNPLSSDRANLAKQAGINWYRADVNFGTFQTTYATASQYGLSIIGILDYDALGMNQSFTLDDWKKVVTRAQKTYPSITVWEIWNEPTQPVFQLGYQDGTPQHYLDLLKAAYTILKAGNPGSTIIGLGGLSLGGQPINFEFAQGVFGLGGGMFMDALSVHAYPGDLNIGKTWDYYVGLWTQDLQRYKQFGKPIWITESGLPSDQNSETDQANCLKSSYQFFKSAGVAGFFWYQITDYYGSSGAIQSWGLLRLDLTAKPAYSVYKDLIRLG